ncbi:hypothetical protein DYB32_005768 [Aphanomyces invadans]|uniref:ATP-dependent RNA helicase n=1 Tax=Aphanomyces invadans TaxID=157072 RepID=A0A3R6Y7F2_9STRA|nr:hypothetical protein DYB32_005768 [Aphanomyces invadans]
MDGFSLNLATSSGPRVVKRKKVTKFRQNKKKAQRKTHAHGSALAGDTPRAGVVRPKHSTTTPAPKPAIVAPPQSDEPSDDEYEPVDESEQDEPDDDASDVDIPAPVASNHPSTDSATKKTQVVPAASASQPINPTSNLTLTKEKGTRRNPNKDAYSADSYLKPSLDMSTMVVHNTPLPSKESTEIFAKQATFGAMKLHPHIVSILAKDKDAGGFGFSQPTRVQVASVPAILAAGDVMLKSETGSGKTLSYCLPIVHSLMSRTERVCRSEGCLALILAPTRELCIQIHETLERLLKVAVYIVAGCVVGGEKKKAEKARLRKGVSILVATPGRLIDHFTNTHAFKYNRLQYLVLDEADRLLDLGFEKSIAQILECLVAKIDDDITRQSILVSATINAGVQRLAALSLTSPKFIDADASKGPESTFATPDQLVQHFMIVPAKQRLCALSAFVRGECRRNKLRAKIVVFMSTCDAVDFVSSLFQKCQWPQSASMFGPPVFRLHGNVNQQDRTATFQAFCKASSGVLFCTDVGNSLLFLLPSESAYCDHLKTHGLNLTALSLESTLARSAYKGEFKPSSKKAIHEVVVHELQYLFEQSVLANTELFDMACQAFQSFVRSYATHASETRQYFHVRSLHFGHVAKSFALREPPASNKVTKGSQQAKTGTLKKRKALQEVDDSIEMAKQKKARLAKRKYNNHVSEFAD